MRERSEFGLNEGMAIAQGFQGLERMDMNKRLFNQDQEEKAKLQEKEDTKKAFLRAKELGQPIDHALADKHPDVLFDVESAILQKKSAERQDFVEQKKIDQYEIRTARGKLSLLSNQIEKAKTPEEKQSLQDQFDEIGAETYNKHWPNGYQHDRFVVENGIKYSIQKDATGKDARKVAVPTREEALSNMAMLDDNFHELYLQKQDLIKQNPDLLREGVMNAVEKDYWYRDSKGNEAAMVVQRDKTGHPVVTYLSKSGKVVQGFDPNTETFIEPKDEYKSPDYWEAKLKGEEKSIDKAKTQLEYAKLAQEISDKEYSRMEKQANNLERGLKLSFNVLKVDEEEAIVSDPEQRTNILKKLEVLTKSEDPRQRKTAIRAIKDLNKFYTVTDKLDGFEPEPVKNTEVKDPNAFIDGALGGKQKQEQKPAEKQTEKPKQAGKQSDQLIKIERYPGESRYEKLKRGAGYVKSGIKKSVEMTPEELQEYRKKRKYGRN